jgi:sigma-B regulation protein RsbU (phosphoserine phosphatase)
MVLAIDPHSRVPVYRQLFEQVRLQIARGLLKPGEKLPSAWELSSELGVNPAGVSKAYDHLEHAGFLALRGEGANVREAGSLPAVRQPVSDDDVRLASQIQNSLLPRRQSRLGGWEMSYVYDPLGPTGGDYCDLVSVGPDGFFFMVGDVTGKGLAAALLMAHLHATFRALVSPEIPVEVLVERVSRAFHESTPATYFATLICAQTRPTGEITICNAGHPAPLLVRDGRVTEIAATGLPVGIFSDESFTSVTARLAAGDTLLVWTDGLTETVNRAGVEYGPERLSRLVRERSCEQARDLVSACRADLDEFRAGEPRTDDVTILAIRRDGRSVARGRAGARGRVRC